MDRNFLSFLKSELLLAAPHTNVICISRRARGLTDVFKSVFFCGSLFQLYCIKHMERNVAGRQVVEEVFFLFFFTNSQSMFSCFPLTSSLPYSQRIFFLFFITSYFFVFSDRFSLRLYSPATCTARKTS